MERRTGEGAASWSQPGGARYAPRSKSALIERCTQLRKHAERKHLATVEEVREAWPKQKRAALWDWVYCYAQLVRFLERTWTHGDGSAVDRDAMAALREDPVEVALSGASTVHVFPKSFSALLWFDARDQVLEWLDDRRVQFVAAYKANAIEPDGDGGPVEILDQISKERGYQLALMAAQACTTGASLVAAPEVDRFLELGPVDIAFIHAAFLKCNAERLRAVHALTTSRPSDSHAERRRFRWSVFFATAGDRWKTNPITLIEDRSLAHVLARWDLSAHDALTEEMEG